MKGVIKGSEQSLLHDRGHLDEAAYLAMGLRGQTVYRQQREAIFNLFQAYQRMQWERHDLDWPDR